MPKISLEQQKNRTNNCKSVSLLYLDFLEKFQELGMSYEAPSYIFSILQCIKQYLYEKNSVEEKKYRNMYILHEKRMQKMKFETKFDINQRVIEKKHGK